MHTPATTESPRLGASPVGDSESQIRQLCRSLAQLNAAQRLSGIGSWEMWVDDGEFSFSAQATAILGPHLDRPNLDSFLRLIPDEDRLRLLKAYRDAFAGQGEIEIEHAIQRPDGSRQKIRQRMQRAGDAPDGSPRLLGTLQDVTAYKAISQALRDSERKFRLLMAHAPHGIALLDAEGVFTGVNTALCELLGYTPDELLGRNLCHFTHPDDPAAGQRLLAELGRGACPLLRYERRCRRKDGSTRWVEVSLSAQLDDAGQFVLLVAHVQDVTHRKEEVAEIRRQIHIDPLTGLPNRHIFMDRLDFIWNQAQRHNRAFAIIYLDLDNFKPINDRHGHATGDTLLIEVARRLLECTRSSDTVARIGGDEFVVLLAEINDRSAPANVAEKILESLSAEVEANGHRFAPRASLGIVSFPAHPFGSPSAMLHAADSAMYTAKRTGGGRYHLGHQPTYPGALLS